MHPQVSPAELNNTQTPFAEIQDAISRLRPQEERLVTRTLGPPTVVGSEQPSLLSKDESPFGVPVRLGVNNDGAQTPDSFYVLDVGDVEPTPRSDGQVERILGNGAAVITSPSATHVLINRYFDGSEEPVPGYQELSPGGSIEISRASEDKEARKIMMERFGIIPIVTSRYSREKHAKVSLSEDQASISVVDLNSKFGTFITTRNQPAAAPEKISRRRRVANAAGRLFTDGAPFTNGRGEEL